MMKRLNILGRAAVSAAMICALVSPFSFATANEATSSEDATQAKTSEEVVAAANENEPLTSEDVPQAVVEAASETQAAFATLTIADTVFDLSNNGFIDVDGISYAATATSDGAEAALPLPASADEAAHFATYLHYNNAFNANASYDEWNTTYPTSLFVWELSYDSATATYTAARLSAFDDVLKYAGCSVRTGEPQGIRLVTSIPTSTKQALTSADVAGYTLVESGTLVQWDEKLAGGNLTASTTTLRGSAYSRATGADPVYKESGGVSKYTNVLTGFSNEQCKPLLSLRPYLILEKEGQEFYLYGGTVHRSIGYIAAQNANEFNKGTAGYRFIWQAIHAAYDDALDETLGYSDWNLCEHVTCIDQYPELPWGCESVACANTLQAFGYSLSKTEIYDSYLSFSSWDYVHAYSGDARECTGIGQCMPPAIVDAANRYLSEQGSRAWAYNITGASFDTLISYIDQGYPVILWSTISMSEPHPFGSSLEGYQSYNNAHCVVMYGHSGSSSVSVSDSIDGYVERDYAEFASMYSRCGSYAVVIL